MTTVEELAAEIVDLRRRVAAAEGVLDILDLKARYGRLVDARLTGGRRTAAEGLATLAGSIASLFVPDGVWDGGPGLGVARGRTEIAAVLSEPTLDFSRHLFVQPSIRVDGDSARGRWELLCPCRRPDGTSYWMSGFEDDEYERVDGAWLFRSMRLTTVLMAPVGEGWSPLA